jgi:hypothetical protein
MNGITNILELGKVARRAKFEDGTIARISAHLELSKTGRPIDSGLFDILVFLQGI